MVLGLLCDFYSNRFFALCLFVLWVGLLALFGADWALAQEKSCSNAQCHSTLGKASNVHPALQVGCAICHQPVDERTMYDGPNHKFKMAAEGAELCYTCHEAKNTKKVVHVPIQAGMCTFCHDPHQSNASFLLKAEPLTELCYQCHEKKDSQAQVHGPVSMGLCTSCHNPHQSDLQRLTLKEGPELCFQCHSQKQEAISTGKAVHPPAMMDCTMCHDPHTAPNQYQLKTLPPDLCFTCHTDIQELITGAKVVHGAVQRDKKCLNCHDPHAAGQEKLVKLPGLALCLGCHDKELKDTKGNKLANIKDLLEKNPNHHGPILAESCVACHNPHGSTNFRLLVRAFPATFYSPFDEKSYALCFGCHDSSLAMKDRTTSDTDFRNGDKNLHFVHVNKKPKGRTCRICHQFHASSQPRHIRSSISFGQWKLPLNYKSLANGGKCLPGCHAPYGYDREAAVNNPIDYKTFKEPTTIPPEATKAP